MAQKPFVLSAKGVVRDREGRCLLLKRSAASAGNPGKWDFPGGKLEPGERIDQALCREVAEETGLTIAVRRVAGAAQSELPDRVVAYLILEGDCEAGEVRLSAEHDTYRWVVVEDLARMDLAPQFRAFAECYCAACSHG